MPLNWQDVITSIGTTLVSATVIVGAVAWVIKTLVSDRLTRQAEAFKIQVKADADVEIERMKAAFSRAARVHERQLDILQKLCQIRSRRSTGALNPWQPRSPFTQAARDSLTSDLEMLWRFQTSRKSRKKS